MIMKYLYIGELDTSPFKVVEFSQTHLRLNVTYQGFKNLKKCVYLPIEQIKELGGKIQIYQGIIQTIIKHKDGELKLNNTEFVPEKETIKLDLLSEFKEVNEFELN